MSVNIASVTLSTKYLQFYLQHAPHTVSIFQETDVTCFYDTASLVSTKKS